MKTKLIFSLFLAATVIFGMTACTEDEGIETKASINGTVTSPDGNAAGAIVTIAFGATEATDASDYRTVSDASGKYSFQGLQKGNYFVDATYTNPDGFTFTTGGYLVEIGDKKAELTVDISVK